MATTPTTTSITTTRRNVLALGGSLAATVGIGPATAAADTKLFRQIPKSVWVWNTPPEELAALSDFARQWNITRVLLGLRPETIDRLATGDQRSVSAIARLRERDVEVIALTGDPSWVERPDVPRSVSSILDIAARRKLFDGLDLDVEPHALAAWHGGDAERAKLMSGHLELFKTLAAQAPPLPLGAALHPVYAKMTLPDGRNYLDALCGTLRSVSLMAYRNRPNATLAWSQPSISVFERASIPWRSGILVHETKDANTSYIGSQPAEFIATMTELDRNLRNLAPAKFYRGLIFEDYKGLRNILASAERGTTGR
jgi:hypothetical protein